MNRLTALFVGAVSDGKCWDDMMIFSDLDDKTPGGVYLCQVSEQVSCGACCGLYNIADISRRTLESMLLFRTKTFKTLPRTVDAILKFKQEIENHELQARPFPEFHHCPFIGLIGDDRSRVGCLLHPLAEGNEGIDFRGLSYYGGLACRSYFCLTCRELDRVYKQIVRELCDDWFLYGLIITETTLLKALFEEIEHRVTSPLTPHAILGHPHRRKALRALLQLKLDWPFQAPDRRNPCNYFFEDQLYRTPPLTYEHLGCPPSRYDVILKELNSKFKSGGELCRAEAILDRLFGIFTSGSTDSTQKVSK